MATPGQTFFGIDMLLNLYSVVYWRVIFGEKQRQVEIDNSQEHYRKAIHDYAIGYQVYVEMTVIYRKLDYKKQGHYIITEFFTNSTVRFQQGEVNKCINIRQFNPHFDE